MSEVTSTTARVPLTSELSNEVRDKVSAYMDQMFQNFQRKVGETVRLICDHPVTHAVQAELPESTLTWSFNDDYFLMDPSRVFYYKGNLDITDLTPGDTGVYECVVKWGSGNTQENITVGVYSLQVETQTPTRYIFEKEPARLDCHSGCLGRLFPASTRRWLLNDTFVNTKVLTLADNTTVDVIDAVGYSDSGVWECQVTHSRTNRTWDTAWMFLSVDKPPIFLARWYRTLHDNMGIVMFIISLTILIALILFLFSAHKLKEKEDESDDQFIHERNGWETTLSKFVEKGEVTVDDIKEKKDKKEDGKSKKEDEKKTDENKKDESKESDDEDDDDVDDKKKKEKDKKKIKGKTEKKSNKSTSEDENENAFSFDTNFSSSKRSKSTSYFTTPAERDLARSWPRSSKSRDRKSKKNRKSSGFTVYPAVTRDLALRWLVKNCPHLRQLDAAMQNSSNLPLFDLSPDLEPLLSSSSETIDFVDSSTTDLLESSTTSEFIDSSRNNGRPYPGDETVRKLNTETPAFVADHRDSRLHDDTESIIDGIDSSKATHGSQLKRLVEGGKNSFPVLPSCSAVQRLANSGARGDISGSHAPHQRQHADYRGHVASFNGPQVNYGGLPYFYRTAHVDEDLFYLNDVEYDAENYGGYVDDSGSHTKYEVVYPEFSGRTRVKPNRVKSDRAGKIKKSKVHQGMRYQYLPQEDTV
ncbi:uncharacterized protein LOC131950473 [Physella acuta]|uniref:uncharacterized protein LOC131950473 n=1 Tax=Physella acuta TaxID=109671 RepID=UPI0027DB863F|nr:uncharacterized protein LOC131950473 [Physella acuta]